MPDEDPFYVRDTIAMLRPYPQDGPWAGRISKMRILKAQIEENVAPAKDKKPALLQAIEEAVERIHAGTYEFCATCGKRIEDDRSRVEAPWITRCAQHRVSK
jgi:RNA polymerase-binding transcription factor DksA